MAIVTFLEALLAKGAGKSGTVLRDRILCGLCLWVGSGTTLIADDFIAMRCIRNLYFRNEDDFFARCERVFAA